MPRGRAAGERCAGDAARELRATSILALPLDGASPTISAGGPDDGETEDAVLPVWAGHLPLQLVPGAPVPGPHLPPGVPVPREIAAYRRPAA